MIYFVKGKKKENIMILWILMMARLLKDSLFWLLGPYLLRAKTKKKEKKNVFGEELSESIAPASPRPAAVVQGLSAFTVALGNLEADQHRIGAIQIE